MIATLAAICISSQFPCDFGKKEPLSLEKSQIGWHDEFGGKLRWSHLAIENKPAISKRKHGLLELELKQVPNGWPYEYQWSGITRHVRVDIAKFPVLQASVPRLVGYAHLDIEVLDSSGKAVKGVRSTTITSPGTIVANLGDSLDPAIYRLRLRLIVRGPNSGCKAVYDWIRFVRY